MAEFAEVYLIAKHLKSGLSLPAKVTKVASEHVCADGLKFLENKVISNISQKGKMILFSLIDLKDEYTFIFRPMFNGTFVVEGYNKYVQSYNLLQADRPYVYRRGEILVEDTRVIFYAQRPIIRYSLGLEEILRQAPDLKQTDLSFRHDTRNAEIVDYLISRYKGTVVEMLRDQNYLYAGIGNYMVSEILFNCGIHPTARAYQLNSDVRLMLRAAIGLQVERALMNDCNYSSFIHVFAQKTYSDSKKTYTVERTKIAGGSVYFIPELQNLYANKT